MRIIIQFVHPLKKERLLADLRHAKKTCAVLRHYIAEVTDDKYYLKDQNGNAVCEFDYLIVENDRAVVFENFRGKLQSDVERMLQFKIPELSCEKAFIFNTEKKMKLFFTLDAFFLIEEGNTFYKIGRDHEAIMPIGAGMIPRELRNGEILQQCITTT